MNAPNNKNLFDQETYRAIIEKSIQEAVLMDDYLMSKVFESKECTELLLHIILKRDDLQVTEVRTEYAVANLQGRSVRLDIYAVDAQGRVYNVEVQNAAPGAAPERARYNLALLDSNAIKPGKDVTELPTTYVIFITRDDVLRGNKPIYHINRIIEETQEHFADRAHIVYVNGSFAADDMLGRLMQDFQQDNPQKMHYEILADRISALKGAGKEHFGMFDRVNRYMREELERLHPEYVAEIKAKGRSEGEAEGEAKGIMSVATNMKRLRMLSDEDIARATNLPLETVKAIVA